MNFDLSDYKEIEFPQYQTIVYVLFFVNKEIGDEIPFYVGMSSRGIGRIGDHIMANFYAPTDFRVGEAVRNLRERGFDVRIKYKECDERKTEKRRIISILKSKARLLNEIEGYDPTLSDEETERAKIHRFLEILTQERGARIDRRSGGISRITGENSSVVSFQGRTLESDHSGYYQYCATSQGGIQEQNVTPKGVAGFAPPAMEYVYDKA